MMNPSSARMISIAIAAAALPPSSSSSPLLLLHSALALSPAVKQNHNTLMASIPHAKSPSSPLVPPRSPSENQITEKNKPKEEGEEEEEKRKETIIIQQEGEKSAEDLMKEDDCLGEAPEKPLPGDCCGSGCVRCVWDIYFEELEVYNAKKSALENARKPSS